MGSSPCKKDTLNAAKDFQISFQEKQISESGCKGEEGKEASFI